MRRRRVDRDLPIQNFINIVLLAHDYDEWLALVLLLALLAICADCSAVCRMRIERRYRRCNGTVVDMIVDTVDVVNQWINTNLRTGHRTFGF